jgi:hypothetical protein
MQGCQRSNDSRTESGETGPAMSGSGTPSEDRVRRNRSGHERLGHPQVSATLDTHSHVAPSLQREAAERLDGLLACSTPSAS